LPDLWPWAPTLPFVETVSFKTDLQMALEAESRTSVRLGRMVYQMAHMFDNVANLEAEGVFDERRLTTFRVPAWGEATEFAGGLPAGVTVLPVADADWRIGGQAFLSGPGRQVEVIAISAVGSGTVTLATPSLVTRYRTPPVMSGALVVGISQSGESPDLIAVVEEQAQSLLRTAFMRCCWGEAADGGVAQADGGRSSSSSSGTKRHARASSSPGEAVCTAGTA
jgi:hypothetical protein